MKKQVIYKGNILWEGEEEDEPWWLRYSIARTKGEAIYAIIVTISLSMILPAIVLIVSLM